MGAINIYPVNKPTPCYDKYGKQIGWYNPRFVCTAAFVYAWSDKHQEWCILGAVRGKGAESFQGEMNCPCGYMDINISLVENAAKELREECGLRIDPSELQLVHIEDDPAAYQQHITMHYVAVLKDIKADESQFSHEENEVDTSGNLEVGDIAFIPLSQMKHYKWAFGHYKYGIQYAHLNKLFWKGRVTKYTNIIKKIFTFKFF